VNRRDKDDTIIVNAIGIVLLIGLVLSALAR